MSGGCNPMVGRNVQTMECSCIYIAMLVSERRERCRLQLQEVTNLRKREKTVSKTVKGQTNASTSRNPNYPSTPEVSRPFTILRSNPILNISIPLACCSTTIPLSRVQTPNNTSLRDSATSSTIPPANQLMFITR